MAKDVNTRRYGKKMGTGVGQRVGKTKVPNPKIHEIKRRMEVVPKMPSTKRPTLQQVIRGGNAVKKGGDLIQEIQKRTKGAGTIPSVGGGRIKPKFPKPKLSSEEKGMIKRMKGKR